MRVVDAQLYAAVMTIPKKPFIYIAGPITLGNPMHHTRKAVEFADILTNGGAVCHVPHLSILWDTITPKHWDFWMDMDMEIILRCDALFRMSGESRGADLEVKHAQENRIPVFNEVYGGLPKITKWIGEYAARAELL
jgi:hypothetical protein